MTFRTDRAVLFDLDGVLMNSDNDSENGWGVFTPAVFRQLLELKRTDNPDANILDTELVKVAIDLKNYGSSHQDIIHSIQKFNPQATLTDLREIADPLAEIVYGQSALATGLSEYLTYLKAHGYKTGIVSNSPQKWINIAIKRPQLSGKFDYTLSLEHNIDDEEIKARELYEEEAKLPSKPAPDGYLYAISHLGVLPNNVTIIEDSTPGITAALAAGSAELPINVIKYTEFVKRKDSLISDSRVELETDSMLKIRDYFQARETDYQFPVA